MNIIYPTDVYIIKEEKRMLKAQNRCGPGTTPYTIKPGDTFFLIARREGITVDALIKANPGVDPDRLFIGQVICIPKSTPPGPTHVICISKFTRPGPTNPCITLRIVSRAPSVS